MEAISQELSKYIVGGFSVVPALAWNDYIKSIFLKFFPEKFGDTALYKLLYAIIITIIAWLIVAFLKKSVNFVSSF